MSSTSMTRFSHKSTPASILMTFLPTHPPNNEANSLSASKHQNLSMTPSRWSPSASETNSRRRSMKTILLSLMILMLVSPMSTPASSTNTLLINMQNSIYAWPTTIKNNSMPPWTPPTVGCLHKKTGMLSSICC